MDWDQVEGSIKEQWSRLADNSLDVIAGKRDQLADKIQEAHGASKEDVEKQIAEWQDKQDEAKQRH